MFYIYLLQNSESKETYTGITADLRQRVKEHNAKGNKFTTRKSGQWNLKYYEAYASKKDAIERESKLKKHGSTKHNLRQRLKHSFEPKIGAGRSKRTQATVY